MNIQIRPNAAPYRQFRNFNPDPLAGGRYKTGTEKLQAALDKINAKHLIQRLSLKVKLDALRNEDGSGRKSIVENGDILEFAAMLAIEGDNLADRQLATRQNIHSLMELHGLLELAGVPHNQKERDADFLIYKSEEFGIGLAGRISLTIKRLQPLGAEWVGTAYGAVINRLKGSDSPEEFYSWLEDQYPAYPKSETIRDIVNPPEPGKTPEPLFDPSAGAVPQASKPAKQNPFGSNFVREICSGIKAEFVALSLGNKVPGEKSILPGSQSQLLRSKMLDRIQIISEYIKARVHHRSKTGGFLGASRLGTLALN